jgi:hypothetical protein
MSLEEALKANTAAVEALTAALLKSGGTAGASSTKTEKKTEAAAYTPKHSKEKMTATMNEVKTKFDTATAKALIKEFGGADKLADVTDLKAIDALTDAGIAKLAEKKEDDM